MSIHLEAHQNHESQNTNRRILIYSLTIELEFFLSKKNREKLRALSYILAAISCLFRKKNRQVQNF